MKAFFYQLGTFDWLLPIYITLTRQNTIFPFYHTVSNDDLLHVKHLFPVKTTKQFEKDIDDLLRHFHPISIEDLANNTCIKKNSFLLSFDDGFSEFYHTIAPILLRKGIPAIMFLNSAFINNKALFYRCKASLLIEHLETKQGYKHIYSQWLKNHPNFSILNAQHHEEYLLDELATQLTINFEDYLCNYKPYLSTKQIMELSDQGFTFGSHSITHPEYRHISLQEQVRQTVESTTFVKEQCNPKQSCFSFPFTDDGVSKEFFDRIQQLQLIDFTFGTAGIKHDTAKQHFHRIPMETKHFSANQIITGEYLYYIAKAFIRKNTIQRI